VYKAVHEVKVLATVPFQLHRGCRVSILRRLVGSYIEKNTTPLFYKWLRQGKVAPCPSPVEM
jgi:hypothetical protein